MQRWIQNRARRGGREGGRDVGRDVGREDGSEENGVKLAKICLGVDVASSPSKRAC